MPVRTTFVLLPTSSHPNYPNTRMRCLIEHFRPYHSPVSRPKDAHELALLLQSDTHMGHQYQSANQLSFRQIGCPPSVIVEHVATADRRQDSYKLLWCLDRSRLELRFSFMDTLGHGLSRITNADLQPPSLLLSKRLEGTRGGRRGGWEGGTSHVNFPTPRQGQGSECHQATHQGGPHLASPPTAVPS